MHYDRITIHWSLIILLGAALHAFAAIHPNGPGTDAPPPDSAQPTNSAPAAEPPSGVSTAVVSSMPLFTAPTPLDAHESQPGAGSYGTIFLFIMVVLILFIAALLKFSSWYKKQNVSKEGK